MFILSGKLVEISWKKSLIGTLRDIGEEISTKVEKHLQDQQLCKKKVNTHRKMVVTKYLYFKIHFYMIFLDTVAKENIITILYFWKIYIDLLYFLIRKSDNPIQFKRVLPV